MYCLVQDNDCHWYVIPVDKNDEWIEYLSAVEAFYELGSLLDNFQGDPIEMPKWADEVGGSPSLVTFPFYQIN